MQKRLVEGMPVHWRFLRAPFLGTLSLLALGSCVPMATAQSADVTCLIEPQELVALSTSVEGIVEEVAVERGDPVEAGDLVAQLQADVERASVALAEARAGNEFAVRAMEAQLDFLEAQQARNDQLRRRQAISNVAYEEAVLETETARQNLNEARLNREIALLELRQAEALLRQKTVRSPIDGVVVERLLSAGEYRNEQSHIVTIAQLDPLRVEVFAPIELYGTVELGDTAVVRPEEPVGGEHEAEIVVVDRVFDVATATFGIRLDLPNPDLAIPAGLRCEIQFR